MLNPGSISFIEVLSGETLEQAYRRTLSWIRPMNIEDEVQQAVMTTTQSRPTTTDTLLAVRGQTHGDYTTHARITQNLKHMMHDTDNWSLLSPTQTETLEMIAHKIGRILAGDPDFQDHWADIAGYAKLQADRSKVP